MIERTNELMSWTKIGFTLKYPVFSSEVQIDYFVLPEDSYGLC